MYIPTMQINKLLRHLLVSLLQYSLSYARSICAKFKQNTYLMRTLYTSLSVNQVLAQMHYIKVGSVTLNN